MFARIGVCEGSRWWIDRGWGRPAGRVGPRGRLPVRGQNSAARQPTARPCAGIPAARGTALQRRAAARRHFRRQSVARSTAVQAALSAPDADPRHEGFRAFLDAVQNPITLLERTDSRPAGHVRTDRIRSSRGPRRAHAPGHQLKPAGAAPDRGVPGGRPPGRTASHSEGAPRAPKIGRRRVATGANHPASQSSAFRRGTRAPVRMLLRNPLRRINPGDKRVAELCATGVVIRSVNST